MAKEKRLEARVIKWTVPNRGARVFHYFTKAGQRVVAAPGTVLYRIAATIGRKTEILGGERAPADGGGFDNEADARALKNAINRRD